MRFERSVEIAVPAEQAYAVYADVERWPEWTDSVESVERVSMTASRSKPGASAAATLGQSPLVSLTPSLTQAGGILWKQSGNQLRPSSARSGSVPAGRPWAS